MSGVLTSRCRARSCRTRVASQSAHLRCEWSRGELRGRATRRPSVARGVASRVSFASVSCSFHNNRDLYYQATRHHLPRCTIKKHRSPGCVKIFFWGSRASSRMPGGSRLSSTAARPLRHPPLVGEEKIDRGPRHHPARRADGKKKRAVARRASAAWPQVALHMPATSRRRLRAHNRQPPPAVGGVARVEPSPPKGLAPTQRRRGSYRSAAGWA